MVEIAHLSTVEGKRIKIARIPILLCGAGILNETIPV